MVGKNQIQITGNQFAQGLATSDFLGDGGVGALSQNINPYLTKGVVYATTANSASGISAPLVISSRDFQTTPTINRVMVDTAGELYSMSAAGAITSLVACPKSPSVGVSDSVVFDDVLGSHNTALYFTTATDITRISGTIAGGLSAGAGAFWTATKSKTALVNGAPHPMLVYQGFMWIGDGQNLHNMDISGTATTNVLTLDVNEEIFSLGIDPNTGLMMIGVRNNGTESNGNRPADSFIYLYDGYSAKARRKIPISGCPFSFTPVAGTVFVGIDNSIGIWNGNGVTFLRSLSNINNIPYKQRIAVINNIFLVADGTQVLAYGDVVNGKKTWFPFYTNTANSNSINVIFQQDIDSLGVNYDSSAVKFMHLLDNGFGGGSGVFYTNNINFERPVFINRIRVFTTGINTTTGIGAVSMIDDKNNTISPTQNKFVVASGTRYVFDFDFGGTEIQTFQPKVTLDTQLFGITKIVVYYTLAE